MNADWRADPLFFSLEERIKHLILPDRLYLWSLVRRRLRKGEKELHILRFVVPAGGTSIDVGANKGVYSYLLSRISEKVEAFEPNPKMHALLEGAVPPNVETHAVALSNESGAAELILPIQRSGRYANQGATLQSKKLPPDKGFGVVRVEQRRLDDYRFSDVTFIKIDVEGYELEVIEGARETLRRERPTLLVEIDEAHSKISREETISAIKRLGYDCFYVSTTDLCHISRFDDDTGKTHTDNFVFFPVQE